ncbi:MAG TPA: hypothetical protein VF695_01420 [Sphingomonas sp.]|jgi:hypothetical protein
MGPYAMAGDRTGSGIGALAVAALTIATPVSADTPTALWRGVTRVGVTCLVNTDRGVDTGVLHDRLCARVRALAAAGAPVPIAAVSIGDPQMFDASTITLLVHASTRGTAGMMAVSIRPYRNAEGTGLLFGAEPRAMPTGANDAQLDAALSVPLSQILPWRGRPGPRPIH